MKRIQKILLASLIAIGATAVHSQNAKFSDGVIRIGVMNDRSGLYADLSGEGSAIAARMAAEEFGNKVRGIPVEIVTADHLNKTDVGVAIAKKWFDNDGVDVIIDIANSAVSLAVNSLVKDRKKLVLHNSSSGDLTGKACQARAVQWQYSAWASSHNVVTKEMIDAGMNTFFIIGVDYAMGDYIGKIFREAVEPLGGQIVGQVRHPINTTDFSSYLLQAQASGAKAIMFGNAGTDLATAVRQAQEFGLTPKVQLMAGALTKDVVKSAGLSVMQGLQTLSWYEMFRDAQSKAWGTKFAARNKGKMPTELNAATYSSVRTYLRAIENVATDDADIVLANMREMTINDAFASNGHIRPDGVMSHDYWLVRLKAPNQSAGDGDYSNIIRTIPGDKANSPLSQSECPLVKKS